MQNHADPTRTQVDAALAAAQQRHASDPKRAELIARTRRFKSSWIELAESLTDCRQNERHKGWGYKNFEDYYRRELHLKGATVDKLVGSFSFLRASAPEVLERDGISKSIPTFQAIDFLRRAEEARLSGNADENTVAEVRRAVMDDNMSLPKITRLFKESLFPGDVDEDTRKKQKEVYKAARKLSDLLGAVAGELPPAVQRQVEEALAALLRSLPQEEESERGAQAAA
jgi:hypothetical protein